jgi:hypothetical protein
MASDGVDLIGFLNQIYISTVVPRRKLTGIASNGRRPSCAWSWTLFATLEFPFDDQKFAIDCDWNGPE